MGQITFSGSWFMFIVAIASWIVLAIVFRNNLKYRRYSFQPFIYKLSLTIMLITIIGSNFQYTSRDISKEVRTFDTPSSPQIEEIKKSDRMVSSDAVNKFNTTVTNVKQENSKND